MDGNTAVSRFADPDAFLARARSFLVRAEAENNLMLGLGGMARAFGDTAYLAVVEEAGAVVACGVRTPPYKAVISRGDPRALDGLACDLAKKYPELPMVFGPEPDVAEFVRRWTARCGGTATRGMRQRLFEARRVVSVAPQPRGHLRVASAKDLPLVTAWAAAFINEALPGEPTDPLTHVRQRIRNGSLFLWDHDGPVSMAGWAGRTERGVRVNFVYTPPEHRRRGYASACVAALTHRLLDEGQAFCCLYADLANPTSNAIYQRIGYRPVCDMSDYILSARRSSGR